MRISDLSSDVCSSDLATHSNDYLAFHPIFCEGRLVAFSGLMVHHLDIGAMNMGTRGWNTEIFQEGVRIPPMKLIEERSEEHTSELQSLMRISYAVFCLKKKKHKNKQSNSTTYKQTQ